MNIIKTYVTTQYRSTRKGGTCDVQKHGNSAELYAPALQPNDWYVVITWGVCDDGQEIELSTVIVKR